ncbi:MAG: preprotein translocase subunit YajC [Rickettsiales bacterium]|nr:preprotein translocase subunit YajC [Rickettsiales bacterium]
MLNKILFSDALAQSSEASAAATQEFSFTSFLPLILIFAVFYFLIIRPQTKKFKEQQQMINNLKVGDKIVTSSGIIGVIKEIDAKENQFAIEIASGVTIKIIKNFVSELADKEISGTTKSDKKSK